MHAAGISDWRSLKSGKLPDLSHRIITTRFKEFLPTWGRGRREFLDQNLMPDCWQGMILGFNCTREQHEL
jgi:hypothetical protein